MTFYQYFCISFLTIKLLVAASNCRGDDQYLPKIVPLKSNQGYMLLNLDVDGVAPTIQYARRLPGRLDARSQVINFKDQKKGFMVFPLEAGTYQITRVNAPYYNLPYWLDTSERLAWEFTIQRSKVNYIGKLIIGKKRGTDFVTVNLLNRIAMDLDQIQQQYQDLLLKYPLITAVSVRDDYLLEYLSEGNAHE